MLHKVKKSNVFQKALSGAAPSQGSGTNYLNSVTLLLRTMLSDKRVYESVPKQLSSLVVSLHTTIFSLTGQAALQSRIASLCQFYIVKKFPQYESVVTQTLPYLLVKSMSTEGKNMDVRSLYQVRSAFGLLDAEDESFESIKSLILRAFMHPSFLDRSKHNDGIKFLAYLMTHLGKNTLRDVHDIVKMQMMDANSAMLASYGTLYFEAWHIAIKEEKTAKEEFDHDPDARLNIETYLIQNLLHHGIHAGNSKVLKAVRSVLSVFFSKKDVDGVDAMCCRVYKPLIWRALSAANPMVRSNGTVLLAEAFPLHDPEAPHSESEEMLKKQCESFATLLKDNDPRVRVVAIKGACRVLGLFWQLVR